MPRLGGIFGVGALLVVITGGCAGGEREPEFVCPEALGSAEPEHLCGWGLFRGSGATQEPSEGVIPYHVIANLFTDDAKKHRFIRLPPGGVITYDEAATWGFPVGTVIAKSFAYPHDARDPAAGERLLETRLLVRETDGWRPFIYKWDEAQTEALRFVAGTRVDVSWIDEEGATRAHQYRIPSLDDCSICHGGKAAVEVLGPTTRQMDVDYDYGEGEVNQIEHLAGLGLLDRAPAAASARARLVDPFGEAPLAARARSYMDSNCAPCHREGGDAQSSGLWLQWSVEDPLRLGICKPPVAAGNGAGGLSYDIVPGDPDASIFVFRMEHTEPDVKMPELGGLAPDLAGAALIREWIAAMEPKGCTGE